MNPFATHGAFSWFELLTGNVEGAKKFYGELFGWEFKKADNVDFDYQVVSLNGQEMAGIMDIQHCDDEKIPPHWGNYITVTDIKATLEKAKELGANVIVEITPIPKVGDFAIIQDPQGAVISMIEYKMAC
ncbi:VOC family protein [Sulfuricurvum sp.]|uniref:VOC family protein n=1 Tax=Sulfuricurvum sp. TaxID=2025608 RepID=UPI003BB75581